MPSPKLPPRKGRGRAEGIVRKASEEAADAADSDADAEGDGEEVAGAGVHVLDALGGFDCDPAAEKSADNRFAARQEEIYPSELRDGNLFKETENAGTDEGSDGCGSDDKPAMIVGEEVPRRSRDRR